MKPCKLTFAQIKRMAENAEWAILINWNDCPELAIKYQKIATRLRNAMWGWAGENTLITGK